MEKEVILYLLETEGDVIAKALQKRRKNGGCSMWRDVGLKWINDNERWDLLKYQWEKDYIDKHYRNLNELTKELKTEIPDNPFDESDTDDELYFDDPDERLDDYDWRMINQELEDMNWKKKDTTLEEYLKNNASGIQRSFYCYVISQMDDESIRSYMDGFRNIMLDYFKDNETKDIPDEVKSDEVTMDFKKQEIDRRAETLSNQVMEELFLLLNSDTSGTST